MLRVASGGLSAVEAAAMLEQPNEQDADADGGSASNVSVGMTAVSIATSDANAPAELRAEVAEPKAKKATGTRFADDAAVATVAALPAQEWSSSEEEEEAEEERGAAGFGGMSGGRFLSPAMALFKGATKDRSSAAPRCSWRGEHADS